VIKPHSISRGQSAVSDRSGVWQLSQSQGAVVDAYILGFISMK
jgi:hypothetical protein